MHHSARIGRALLSAGSTSYALPLHGQVYSVRRSASTQAKLWCKGAARRRCMPVMPAGAPMQLLGDGVRECSKSLSTDSKNPAKEPAMASSPPIAEPHQAQTGSDALQKEADALKTTPTPAQQQQQQQQQQQPVREPQSVSEFAEEDKKPLPYLSAPLGLPDQPSSKKLSWTEKRDLQFNYETRMKRRKALIKEASRGYFHDVHAMRAHGGKTWLAPTTLIRQDRSLYFPAIEGKCLANKYTINTADMLPGKVSLVCILTSQVSEEHLKSFYASTYEVYKNDANFQLVQINLQENYIKAALVSIFMSSLRRQIDEQLHKTYMLSHQDLTVERHAIALHNKHVGYIYLVGPDAKIRWAGCGFAERHESQALVACTGVLLSRLNETQAGKTGGAASTTMGR